MSFTVAQLGAMLQQHGEFLASAEESLAGRRYHLMYAGSTIPGQLDLPPALQTANTRVVEIFNADWSSLDQLDGPVVAYLGDLCEFFENVHGAHAAAVDVFHRSATKREPYLLYLRSFSQVAQEMYAGRQGRVVAWVNDQRLDRNVASALAALAHEFHPVTCAHTDDLALIAGRWLLPGFRVHDHTWKNVVRAVLGGSRMIVFYVGDEGEGVRFELDAIRRAGLAARTVILRAEGTKPAGNRYADFAVVTGISSAVVPTHADNGYRLSDDLIGVLRKLARDKHRPPPVPAWLTSLPCSLVDPRVPEEAAARYDLAHSYFVTASNITALTWYASGFPTAFETWNRIARGLFREKRAPSRDDVDALQRAGIMASVGAAALGLPASLACLIGLRTIFAGIVVEPDAARRKRRKQRFLQLFDLADRFDALTTRHFWRPQIAQWRESIAEDAFS